MLVKRILSSLVLIPVLYMVVWKLPPLYFVILAMIATGISLFEFYGMALVRGIRPLSIAGIVLGMAIIFNIYQPIVPELGADFVIAFALLSIMLVRLFSPRTVEGSLEEISITFFGLFYVALLFGFQVAILLQMDGKQWLFFMYLVIWASDAGAYFVGNAIGRHRLYEKISPKKSMEGLAGGMLAAVGAAFLCRAWFIPTVGVQEAVMLGVLLTVSGVAGDLVESLFKRGVGIKDVGNLIPGHGGLLDRMDSMLFTAPILFYYLVMR